MASSSGMDCIAGIRNYIDKIMSSIEGMKVLLLDAETINVVSMVYSQTTILEKEVYLVERLDADHEPMLHLRAVCFLRPTPENIQLLCKELEKPKYAEYHIFFANIVDADSLRSIAEADELDSVRQVQEYYGDYMAINPELFTVNVEEGLLLSAAPAQSTATLAKQAMDRTVQGILSLLLSFKKKPNQIRYQGTSPVAGKVANEVHARIQADQIFDFRRQEGPLLLILDRRDDPVTPLLSQWTYQAMVHELLGLNKNRVSLAGAPNIKDDLKEVVLSCTQDDFFASHRNSNFGDLGLAVASLLEDYKKQANLNAEIKSIQDMQRFLENYPAFRSHSLNVSKHVALVSELARLVGDMNLMEVSEFEQALACDDDHALHFKNLCERIADPKVKHGNKLRLALLYALRYEDQAQIPQVKQALYRFGLGHDKISIIDALLMYAGANRRAPGLYGSALSTIRRKMQTTLQGVSNVYAQHNPLLVTILEATLKGKLKESHYPGVGPITAARPSDVIVFMVGGVTYEETTKVAEMNAASPNGPRIILGGTGVHNSQSFMDQIKKHFGTE